MDTNKLYPVGRALAGLLFLVSGINKILGFSYVAGWMSSSGLPAAGVLLALTILLEVGAGLALITGFQARFAAAALALFLVPVTLIFHGFWHADAAELQNQLNHFLKNVAILGGMLIVFDIEQQRYKARSGAGARLLRGRTA
ncbi:DoxX family protein [Herbaspirillum sp. SJZ107]|uniref:DoxX family protein n=1 Tax=Herbaspirillum sp. SJZ107 TaxID=2572881 RepID=UPI00114EF9E7|nr:DoxX family protein [Herbaspirillum sp. SJZ107]TQK04731.1 putative oxidoreductase [Herbaspirillum sp. SJZ107]